MLERAVGCLKTGGRLLVRTSTKSIRSRRSLHSAFWTHGAGEIDLPSWWIYLLQLPSCAELTRSDHARHTPSRDRPMGLLERGMLDFLYPTQTPANITRFSRIDGNVSKARHQKQARLPRSRAFTSDATLLVADSTGDSDDALAPGQTQATQTEATAADAHTGELTTQAHGNIEKEPALLGRQGYEEAWRLYQNMQGSDAAVPSSELTKLLDLFATSSEKVDAERSIVLIDQIPLKLRRAIDYNHAILAAIRLEKLEKARSLHREASLRIQGLFGTAALLRYTVVNESWQAAVETWDEYWYQREMYFETIDLWTAVDTIHLPHLIRRAISAGQYALGQLEGSNLDGLPTGLNSRDFAIQLIIRTLRVKGINFDADDHIRLFRTLKALKDPDVQDYKKAILQQLSINDQPHGRAAIMYYRDLTATPGLVPNDAILKAILGKFRQVHSAFGIRLVLSDYRRHHGGPTAYAYREIIHEEAHQGDADAVHGLFNERCNRFGKPSDVRDVRPLLIVHSRRAEIHEVCKQFHRLSPEFGIEPDVQCWNIVIAAHARAGDAAGALDWFTKLLDSTVHPDAHSFGTMMDMYASRGDLEAVEELLQQSRSAVEKMTTPMVDSLVLAHIRNDDVEEAEKMAETAVDIDLQGTKTRMWNYLLHAYAFRGDIENLARVHKRLKDIGVPQDNMTYAAIMQGLVIRRRLDDAEKILKVVMPKKRIQATATHYAVLMGGYLAIKQYYKIFELYRRMIKRQVRPLLSTQTMMIKATAEADRYEQQEQGIPEKDINRSQAEAMLELAVSNMDAMDISAREPLPGIGVERLDEAFVSTHFDYLIFVYGLQQASEKVSDLFDKYMDTVKRFKSDSDLSPVSPPTSMLSALMVAHLQQNDYENVERCWDLALEKGAQLACRAGVTGTSGPGWVLPSRRFILNLPLLSYMRALDAQEKVEQLSSTVSFLHTSGYALDNRTWNLYIEILARGKRVLEAFTLCEQHLMPGWLGWRNPNQFQERLKPRSLRLFHLAHLSPHYQTMVNLAAAFVDLKIRNAHLGRDREMETLLKEAPRTSAAVTSMPRRDDDLQMGVLKRW
ncbi:MAG: hypothetical protein FRX48_07524 [Lasallia pustulata]|uniref:Tetratricopeptide-like helical domain n=1 Tax=Lasallia pustulata TaxID=136370 RepID=A0A5M8PIK3_9LECA|nr:MAG: hypothetical protein FRX48_07524 [Lasallia pustulata]